MALKSVRRTLDWRARRVPDRMVISGGSRSSTGTATRLLTCKDRDQSAWSTIFASRGSGVRVPLAPPRSRRFFERLSTRSEGRTAAKWSSRPSSLSPPRTAGSRRWWASRTATWQAAGDLGDHFLRAGAVIQAERDDDVAAPGGDAGHRAAVTHNGPRRSPAAMPWQHAPPAALVNLAPLPPIPSPDMPPPAERSQGP